MTKVKQTKIVIVGDIGVGKSSIALRYSKDDFNPNQESTLGAAYVEKIHKLSQEKAIKFQIWDTAGQQKFRSISKLYYRDSKVAFLVYDVTRTSSFQSLKKWAEDIEKHSPKNILFVLIANKMDLINEETKNSISYEEGMKFARQLGAIFKAVSAKQNKGITELFESVAERVMSSSDVLDTSDETANERAKKLGKKKKKEKVSGCC